MSHNVTQTNCAEVPRTRMFLEVSPPAPIPAEKSPADIKELGDGVESRHTHNALSLTPSSPYIPWRGKQSPHCSQRISCGSRAVERGETLGVPGFWQSALGKGWTSRPYIQRGSSVSWTMGAVVPTASTRHQSSSATFSVHFID